MAQGVKWDLPTSEILEAIKKGKGVISHISKALRISPQTFYDRMNAEDEIKKAIDEARREYDLTMLDEAEDTLSYALNRKNDDLGNALKAVFYILNNKGRSRGYNPIDKGEGYDARDIERLERLMHLCQTRQDIPKKTHSSQSDSADNT